MASVFITDDSDTQAPPSPTSGASQGSSDVGAQGAGQKTLDVLTAIKNAPPENQRPSGEPYGDLQPVGGVSPDDKGRNTLQFLQAVKAGTLAPPKTPYETTATSLGAQVGAGLSDAAIKTIGLPVDLTTGVMNLVPRAVNAVTGSNIPLIEHPFGGSESVGKAFGAIDPRMDPANAPAPQNTAEAIARGIGSGAGAALTAPALGAAIFSSAAPKVAQAGQTVFGGGGQGPLQLARNAGVGAVAGGTGEGAANVVPEPWKPTVRLIGNIAGGALGAIADQAPALARSAYGSVRNIVEPMTSAGPQSIADRALASGLTNRNEAAEALSGDQTGIGGVPRTTYQATGDPGAGAMERAAETGSPQGTIDFNARRAAQNEARVGAIRALQPTGDPAAVSGHIRDQLADIDDMTAGVERQATTRAAQTAAANVGSGVSESAGAAMRKGLVKSHETARAWEKALWRAVDPDGSLTMGAAPISSAARRIESTIPKAAKGLEGEESRIFEAAQKLDVVSKFSEITALRSRISDEMRAQRGPNGNPTVLARLTQLRGAVERAIEDAGEHKGAEEARAVASGAMTAEDTAEARLIAQREQFYAAKRAAGGNGGAGNGARDASGSPSPSVNNGTVGQTGRGPDQDAGAQGVSSQALPNLDPEAAARIKAASAATKGRAQTFRSGAVGEALAEQGAKNDFRILDSQVGAKFFKPGNTGAESVKAFRTAVGNDPEAMRALEGFAGLSLRKAAMNEDGVLDPAKFAAWQKTYADALREMPDVAAKFATAAKAAEAVADSTAMRSAALDGYQKGALAPFLKVADAEDVTRTVGAIFGQKNAIGAMRQLAAEVKNNPDARDGLRKAIADFLTSKAISNTDDVKSDVFQTFVRQNRPVLAQVFGPDELKGIDAVAAELSHVNRLANQAKLPGRSTTAQDLLATKAHGSGHLSLFSEMMLGAGAGYEGAGIKGALGGAALAIGKSVIASMRAAGMAKAQDLLRGMLLNPELARAALERAPLAKTAIRDVNFRQQLNRVAMIAASRIVAQKQDSRIIGRQAR